MKKFTSNNHINNIVKANHIIRAAHFVVHLIRYLTIPSNRQFLY